MWLAGWLALRAQRAHHASRPELHAFVSLEQDAGCRSWPHHERMPLIQIDDVEQVAVGYPHSPDLLKEQLSSGQNRQTSD